MILRLKDKNFTGKSNYIKKPSRTAALKGLIFLKKFCLSVH